MFKLSCYYPGVAKGFQMTFANGYRVSVQWGAGNYCENYSLGDYSIIAPNSMTAETAIIGSDNNFHEYKGDDVQGRQTPEEVLETMLYAANLPRK